MEINPVFAVLAFVVGWQLFRFFLDQWYEARWEREVRRVHEDMERRWEEQGGLR